MPPGGSLPHVAHTGTVMQLQLKADKKAVAGAYELKLTNIVLSDTDGITTHTEDAVATVNVIVR